MAEKVTIMKLKVDLQCEKCYKKVKKVLCQFPQIRDQVYDEKHDIVTIKVVCCSPEKLRDKLCCKGRGSIKSIEIVEPPKPRKEPAPKPLEPKPAESEPAPKSPEPKPAESAPKSPEPKPAESAPMPQKPKPVKPAPTPRAPEPARVPVCLPVVPIGVCCLPCSEGRPGGPCFDGYYGRPPPCYAGYYGRLDCDCGCGGRPVYDCSCGCGGRPVYDCNCGCGGRPVYDCNCGCGGRHVYDCNCGCGGRTCYVSRCDLYFDEENASGCAIM